MPQSSSTAPSVHKQIRAAAILMMASVMLSRVVGFTREWVLAHTVGASGLTDVYYASFTLPDFINYLMAAGALSISFIPIVSRYIAEENVDGSRRLFRTLSTVMVALICFFVLLGEFFAPTLSYWVAPGFDPERQRLLTQLIRIILPAQILFYWGGMAIAVQQAHGKFLYSALAPILYNAGIIGFGVAFHRTFGIASFSIGVVVGCLCSHGILQWWGLRQLGYSCLPSFHFSPQIRADLKRYLWLTLPIMLGFSLVVTDEWISKYFGSELGERAVSWLSYARTQLRIPVAVLGQAAGIASFPYLARLWNRGDKSAFAETFLVEIHRVGVLGVAATVLLVQHPLALTYAIFGGGKFSPEDYVATAECLRMFGWGLSFWVIQTLVARGYYAQGKTWLPSLVGTALSLTFIPLYSYLANAKGVEGLALAGSIGITVYCVLLWAPFHRNLMQYLAPHRMKQFYRSLMLMIPLAAICVGVSLAVRALNVFHQTQISGIVESGLATAVLGLIAWSAGKALKRWEL